MGIKHALEHGFFKELVCRAECYTQFIVALVRVVLLLLVLLSWGP